MFFLRRTTRRALCPFMKKQGKNFIATLQLFYSLFYGFGLL